ncbi:putative Methyltransferase [Seiridium unicorne]|uniref:Methyltransferase n=2 Tax=Seiridium TaxID=138063 RepID=A0ABR2UGI5_9PEZI
MTTGLFKYIDTSEQPPNTKPWSKVDADATSFKLSEHERSVNNLRGHESEFTTDNSGFAVIKSPATEKKFTDDTVVRSDYYQEVEALLRKQIPGIKKVVIFDHTIRRRLPNAPRAPVQQVHVDQTPGAADVRVRRHVPKDEAEELLKGRYQIINVWRPIENPASDFPLAVIDWRTTQPEDFVPVDLLYPKRVDSVLDDDDRGKEVRPDESKWFSTEGYEVRGETMAVRPSAAHKFYYQKDMTPDEVLLLKCYDSFGDGLPKGRKGLAVRTPHTAFIDPATPKDAPGRQSIEINMASRFGGSNLHQRDSRSALFEGYKGGADTTRRQYSASPASVGGGYGYSGGYPGSNGSGGHLGVQENKGFRPATPNSRGQYDTATLDELESQNDQEVSGIMSKVKVLKTLSVAMGDEIRDSSAMMDKMNDTFDTTRLRLRGTMNRMLLMAERTGVGWKVWLGFFAAVVLIFIYVWLF